MTAVPRIRPDKRAMRAPRVVALAGKVTRADAETVRRDAQKQGVTISTWVATAIRRQLGRAA